MAKKMQYNLDYDDVCECCDNFAELDEHGLCQDCAAQEKAWDKVNGK